MFIDFAGIIINTNYIISIYKRKDDKYYNIIIELYSCKEDIKESYKTVQEANIRFDKIIEEINK